MRRFSFRHIVTAFAGTAGALSLAGAAQAAVYSGNGAGGFGGPVGSGSLSVTDSGGNVTFSFTPSGGSLGGNDLVLYIDSTTGGFTDTSSFGDNGDGGREAVSGFNAGNPSRTIALFSTGFTADYAISIEDSYVGLFQLASGGNNSLNYITGNTPSGGVDSVTLPLADLGVTPGQSFAFEGSLISTSAYRSDETIGASSTPNGNPGFSDTLTFLSSDTYTTTAVPEPTSLAIMGLGGLLLGRRRHSRTV